MTFSIEQFKSKGLIYGGARPSLFKVFIPPFPDGTVPGSNHNLSEEISFVAKAASIPPSILDYIDVPYFSRKVKVNGDRTFPDWTITVMNDEDFIRHAFEDWHQAINSREPNRQFGSGYALVRNYKRDLIVYQYGKTGSGTGEVNNGVSAIAGSVDDSTPIAKYTLFGAFPTAVSPIGLDWDYVNQIEQFDVTFTYDYWEPFENTGSLTNTIPLPRG